MVQDTETIWKLLETVTDPEIPVISLKDLGVLRAIEWQEETVVVKITPTYTGCPAIHHMQMEIEQRLAEHGMTARVETQISPAWTTDWISATGREKLQAYGIAPPHPTAYAQSQSIQWTRLTLQDIVACPLCFSENTTQTSHFGSTACKALYKCLDCLEPFDYFKPY